jgi:hypothetical protein
MQGAKVKSFRFYSEMRFVVRTESKIEEEDCCWITVRDVMADCFEKIKLFILF